MIPLLFYFMCSMIGMCDLEKIASSSPLDGNQMSFSKEDQQRFRNLLRTGQLARPKDKDLSPFATIKGLVPSPENDPPKKYCGYKLINAVKDHCWPRSTYSSDWHQHLRALKEMNNGSILSVSGGVYRRKRKYSLCKEYALTAPDAPVTQCCCKGCTKFYLESFCEYPDENTPRKYLNSDGSYNNGKENDGSSSGDDYKVDLNTLFPGAESMPDIEKIYRSRRYF